MLTLVPLAFLSSYQRLRLPPYMSESREIRHTPMTIPPINAIRSHTIVQFTLMSMIGPFRSPQDNPP